MQLFTIVELPEGPCTEDVQLINCVPKVAGEHSTVQLLGYVPSLRT